MEQQDRPPESWRQVWRQVAAIALAVFWAIIGLGYAFKLGWVGVVDYKDATYKTLWDWLALLTIPAVLGVGGYLFTRFENRRAERIADQQRTVDLKIAEDRRQDDMLQAYLDGTAQLLTNIERPLHRAERGDYLSTVTRARTLTVLARLRGELKGTVVQFLYESGLISSETYALKRRTTKDYSIVDLSRADLSGADFSRLPPMRRADLSGADLSGANLRGVGLGQADLSRANLSRADLSGAYLGAAHLYNANLGEAVLISTYLGLANLPYADLRGANLSGRSNLHEAYMRGADLRNANLSDAYMPKVHLFEANLRGVDLSRAYLRRAMLYRATGITNEELDQQARSLEGATMPDAQRYEEWRK